MAEGDHAAAEREAVLADLITSLAAIGRSMQEAFDPRRFLAEFCASIQRLVPHDRLTVALLDEGARTFTIFAEHATRGPAVYEGHYTTEFDPGGRYVVREWAIRSVFAGEAMLVEDFQADPRFVAADPDEPAVAAGYRSALLLPLVSRGRVIGSASLSSLAPGAFTVAHGAAARLVFDLAGPFIENVVLLERERRRRERLGGLEALTRVLGASLDVRGVFDRLAEAVRPILDFDIMGLALISASGRDLEFLAEVDAARVQEAPARMPLEAFSFGDRVAKGESILVHDAPAELDRGRPGDAMIVDGGGRSCLGVPLWLGERVGGGLYFGKRRPYWYDGADVEVATGIAAQVVMAVQHQRQAEDERRANAAEGKAERLQQRLESLRGELGERYGFDRIVGRARPLREALALAARVAPTDTTVLITGESGTGKELVARAIHHASLRADGPFVGVNCAALPENLLESELFGHERGAFTGADRQKPGRFELAAGGTLFLDEVAELTPPIQAKLLRVLQEREFSRVGGTVTLKANARIVAATNRHLDREVEAGRFREDLYYRLAVFAVHLPALRDRGEDVLLLADHLVRELAGRMGKAEAGLSRGAREALLAHPWRGNIRELQNAVERALIVSEGGLITASELGLAAGVPERPAWPATEALAAAGPRAAGALEEVERAMVRKALESARGNKSEAARALGLTRSQLYTRMKRFGLD